MGFAMLFGTLGGLVHATNSLIAFVGNSRFVASWVLFYLARPFIGATMALFVFLIFRGQLAADTVKASNLVAVAAVAALAGLFSDRTAEKLREIFDVLIGPKRDDRTNKLEGGVAAAPSSQPSPHSRPHRSRTAPRRPFSLSAARASRATAS
jgi:hypothetical protein